MILYSLKKMIIAPTCLINSADFTGPLRKYVVFLEIE